MPPVKIIDKMPPEIRAKIDKWLTDNNYGDYRGLSAALAEMDCEISFQALANYGRERKEEAKRIKDAASYSAALLNELGGNMHNIGLVAMAQMQEQVASFMREHHISDIFAELEEPDKKAAFVTNLMRNLPALSRGMVTQETRRSEVMKRLEELEKEASEGKGSGLDVATLQRVRQEIYGLF